MSDYGALSITKEGLDQELKRLKNIMTGAAPGVMSKLLDKQNVSSIPKLETFITNSETQKQNTESLYEVITTRSLSRDVPYAMVGRRYLFTNGLNRKILSVKSKQG